MLAKKPRAASVVSVAVNVVAATTAVMSRVMNNKTSVRISPMQLLLSQQTA